MAGRSLRASIGAGGRRDRAGAAGDVATERTEGPLADGESAAAALNGGYQVGAGLSPVAIAVALCCAPSSRPRRSARPAERGGRLAYGEPDETMTAVNAASPTMNGESLWPRLAGLPLVIEACEYERLHAVLAYEFERITTHVRLVGAGADGLGEDVSVFREDGTALHETRPSLPLEGEWTLAGFCDHVATLDLWPEPPEWDVALRLRNWAFESAALDLALRQAGRSLHDVLGLEPQPVRFVNSLGLGKEPSIEPVRRRLARSRGVRFKLDAEATWAPALVDEVAATGAVDTIDFKGQYGFEVKDPEALGALYDHVLAAFPDAYLEDPHDLPEIAQRLGDHLERVSYDSPIRSAEDIGATPLAARVVNVKPSRIGSLRRLFEVYARCARERRPMYGGGMGELGVGRGQIELLAALFHADAPNDVAPSAYNEDDPPGGLPASPLAPRPEATGFRWAA
jgi:hypothetical protein